MLTQLQKWLTSAGPPKSVRQEKEESADLPPGLAEWDDPPDLFGIVSWGCAATRWIAKALTAVPDVLCLHNVEGFLTNYTGYAASDERVEYLMGLRDLGLAYRLVGEIHGITRNQVPRVKEQLGKHFQTAVVVRSPLPRLMSQLRLFADYDYSERAWTGLDYVLTLDGYDKIAHLVTERKHRFFVHGANLLNAILVEAPLGPVFRCEDLTTSPSAFQGLVTHLSAGKISVPLELAERIVTVAPVNMHGKKGAKIAIEEDWQIAILQAIIRPEAMQLYANLGYEMPAWWADASCRTAA